MLVLTSSLPNTRRGKARSPDEKGSLDAWSQARASDSSFPRHSKRGLLGSIESGLKMGWTQEKIRDYGPIASQKQLHLDDTVLRYWTFIATP